MSGGITLQDAKREARRVRSEADYGRRHQRHPTDGRTRADEAARDLQDTEPADPASGDLDHEDRRQTRIAPAEYVTADSFPKPLVECGCDSCPASADPLADEEHVFRSDLMAADICDDPRAVTVERAAEIYLRYQRASYNAADRTSKLKDTETRYGQLLGAERSVLKEMDDPTLIFLSLRVSPTEWYRGERHWVPPVVLSTRLSNTWRNPRRTLNRHLRDYDSEYATITAMTTSAATPHRHVLVYVEDPDDEVGIEVAQAAVDSHVNTCRGAKAEDHPVEAGQSDAGMIFHDPPKADCVSEDTLLEVFHKRGDEPYPLTTVPMLYVATQLPHWPLKNVYDGTSDVHADSVEVDGGAVAWASPTEYSHSKGFTDDAMN